MATEAVPADADIEITGLAAARAAERLGLQGHVLLAAARTAKRVDRYKDGMRLWRVGCGWLAVHEHQLAGGSYFRAVVVDAYANDHLFLGWTAQPRRLGRVA